MRKVEHKAYPEPLDLEIELARPERRTTAPPDPFLTLELQTVRGTTRTGVPYAISSWACWQAPQRRGRESCWRLFSHSQPGVYVCPSCGREYGLFGNPSAPEGRLLLTLREGNAVK